MAAARKNEGDHPRSMRVSESSSTKWLFAIKHCFFTIKCTGPITFIAYHRYRCRLKIDFANIYAIYQNVLIEYLRKQ